LFFRIFRPREAFIDRAVVPDALIDTPFSFKAAGFGSKLGSFKVSNNDRVDSVIPTIGIISLLRGLTPEFFDSWTILSVDAEGMDPAIIEPIKFNDYPFTLVAFENVFHNPTHFHLIGYGYALQSTCGPTYINFCLKT
jgi:hypothetical protein